MLSNLHFALEWDGVGCRLRDLNSRFGTQINKAKVTEAVVHKGDVIVAGRTTFVLCIEEESPGTAPAFMAASIPAAVTTVEEPKGLAPRPESVLTFLQQQSEPLFA